jgi:hypothetical protein
MRRKTSPTPLLRATSTRPIAPATEQARVGYANVLERARALGLFALVTIAPLGLAGSVAACGGARPAEARPYPTPMGYAPPPVETIAPPASAAPAPSAVPPTKQDE